MAVEYRARSLGTALRYRGSTGMWSWILHRLTGLGVLLFLIIHVVDTGIIIYRPDLYEEALGLYQNPVFRIAELLIFFSVLFHAANGLRIIVQDFRPKTMEHHRQLTWAAVAVVVLAMIPVTWIMVAPLFGLAEEPGVERHQERCAANPGAPACLEAGDVVLEVAP